MSGSLIVIQQGEPIVNEVAVTFLGTGSAGDPDATRRLVYPATVSPFLAPISYQVGSLSCNPTRTLNLDNVVLAHPLTTAVRTLGTTRVLRYETAIDDVIVTEIWEGNNAQAAMPTALFRLFYEYLINPPPVAVDTPAYIQWEPRDRNTLTYEVELLSLAVGGGSGESQFDLVDVRDVGGVFRGGTVENALDGLSPEPTGVIDREVRLRFKILGLVE